VPQYKIAEDPRQVAPEVAPPERPEDYAKAYSKLVLGKLLTLSGVHKPKNSSEATALSLAGSVPDMGVGSIAMTAPVAVARAIRGSKLFHGTEALQQEASILPKQIEELFELVKKELNYPPFKAIRQESKDALLSKIQRDLGEVAAYKGHTRDSAEAGMRMAIEDAFHDIPIKDVVKVQKSLKNLRSKWPEVADNFSDAVSSLLDASVPPAKMIEFIYPRGPGRSFTHFSTEKAGQGAGGDLYGRGIYLTESPDVASGYAGGKGAVRSGSGLIRQHNLPPQAKILDIHAPVTDEFIEAFAKSEGRTRRVDDVQALTADIKQRWNEHSSYFFPEGNATVEDFLFRNWSDSRLDVREAALQMGYDGIKYRAGKFGGTKHRGDPSNYVIYNYDVINKPRHVAAERAIREAEEATAKTRVYHVGSYSGGPINPRKLGSGEGNRILGPGLYASTEPGVSKLYNKYGSKTYEADINLNEFYDPIQGSPNLKDKMLRVLKDAGLTYEDAISMRGIQSLRHGSGLIGAVVKTVGPEKARHLFIRHGIKGAKEKLPSGAWEIAIYDSSVLKRSQ